MRRPPLPTQRAQSSRSCRNKFRLKLLKPMHCASNPSASRKRGRLSLSARAKDDAAQRTLIHPCVWCPQPPLPLRLLHVCCGGAGTARCGVAGRQRGELLTSDPIFVSRMYLPKCLASTLPTEASVGTQSSCRLTCVPQAVPQSRVRFHGAKCSGSLQVSLCFLGRKPTVILPPTQTLNFEPNPDPQS